MRTVPSSSTVRFPVVPRTAAPALHARRVRPARAHRLGRAPLALALLLAAGCSGTTEPTVVPVTVPPPTGAPAGGGTGGGTVVAPAVVTLDTAFGIGGILASGGGAISTDRQGRLLLLTDGLTRLTDRGALDGTFGNAGRGTAVFNGCRTEYVAPPIETARGYVRACSTQGFSSFGIARYTTSGTLDGTFGVNGYADLPFSTGIKRYSYQVVERPDGRLLLFGAFGTTAGEYALIQVDAGGRVDSTFGTNGRVRLVLGQNALLFRMRLLPDGRVLLAGLTVDGVLLVRRLANGAADASFGTGGTLRVAVTGGVPNTGATLFLFGPGERITVVGDIASPTTGTLLRARVLRLDGATLDAGFATGGATDLPTIGGVSGAVLDGAGRLYVAGSVTRNVGGADPGIVRLRADGAPDAAFGTNGILPLAALAGVRSDAPATLSLDPQGRLVVGTFTQTFRLRVP